MNVILLLCQIEKEITMPDQLSVSMKFYPFYSQNDADGFKNKMLDQFYDVDDSGKVACITRIDPRPEEIKIGEKTLSEWVDFAKNDNCLNQMSPSDLQMILQELYNRI